MEKSIHSSGYEKLREWLVEQRHNRNITQRQLAINLNVAHSWVGKIEIGERRLDIIEYVRICKVLDLDPSEGINIIYSYV